MTTSPGTVQTRITLPLPSGHVLLGDDRSTHRCGRMYPLIRPIDKCQYRQLPIVSCTEPPWHWLRWRSDDASEALACGLCRARSGYRSRPVVR